MQRELRISLSLSKFSFRRAHVARASTIWDLMKRDANVANVELEKVRLGVPAPPAENCWSSQAQQVLSFVDSLSPSERKRFAYEAKIIDVDGNSIID